MEMIQAEFTNKTETFVAWVDAKWNLKVNDVVSFLETPNEKWTAVKVYTTKIPYEQLTRKWGLELPKSQRTER